MVIDLEYKVYYQVVVNFKKRKTRRGNPNHKLSFENRSLTSFNLILTFLT